MCQSCIAIYRRRNAARGCGTDRDQHRVSANRDMLLQTGNVHHSPTVSLRTVQRPTVTALYGTRCHISLPLRIIMRGQQEEHGIFTLWRARQAHYQAAPRTEPSSKCGEMYRHLCRHFGIFLTSSPLVLTQTIDTSCPDPVSLCSRRRRHRDAVSSTSVATSGSGMRHAAVGEGQQKRVRYQAQHQAP